MKKAAPTLRVLGKEKPLCDMVRAVLSPPFREAEGEEEDLLVSFVPAARVETELSRIRKGHPLSAVILISPSATAAAPLGHKAAVLPDPFLFRDLLFAAKTLTADGEVQMSRGEEKAVFDPARRTLVRGEVSLSLTEKETAFLVCLSSAPGEYVPFETVEQALWPDLTDRKNACRVLVSYLRRKLEEAFGPGTLVTARGRGYLLKLS